jgi:hypothetical protein
VQFGWDDERSSDGGEGDRGGGGCKLVQGAVAERKQCIVYQEELLMCINWLNSIHRITSS